MSNSFINNRYEAEEFLCEKLVKIISRLLRSEFVFKNGNEQFLLCIGIKYRIKPRSTFVSFTCGVRQTNYVIIMRLRQKGRESALLVH